MLDSDYLDLPCPACAKNMRCPKSYAGQAIVCPGCSHPFMVPGTAPPPPAVPPLPWADPLPPPRPREEPLRYDQHELFKTNRLATYVSAASFLLAAGFWMITIIGIPLAFMAGAMATFELVTATSESKRTPQANRERYKLVGILEIVVGVLTFANFFSIVCGIVNLASLPDERLL